MANVAHSTLTGANLHEPKGIAAATADKVYISDGAGSGAWTATSTIPGIFGSALFVVADEKTAGTNNSDIASGSVWHTRTLNTTRLNQITGASLSSNALSLPAGTYYCRVAVPTYIQTNGGTILAKSRLYNNTDASNLLVGQTFYSVCDGASIVGATHVGIIEGTFTLGSTKSVIVQSICSTASAILGGGFSTTEVYTTASFWKIA
jgi:hypothetical protein